MINGWGGEGRGGVPVPIDEEGRRGAIMEYFTTRRKRGDPAPHTRLELLNNPLGGLVMIYGIPLPLPPLPLPPLLLPPHPHTFSCMD
jgi:hypothetical protein